MYTHDVFRPGHNCWRVERVWVRPRSAQVHFAANASKLARRASDHLPVTAIVGCPPNEVPLERGAVNTVRRLIERFRLGIVWQRRRVAKYG
jgi:hypothetical protein